MVADLTHVHLLDRRLGRGLELLDQRLERRQAPAGQLALEGAGGVGLHTALERLEVAVVVGQRGRPEVTRHAAGGADVAQLPARVGVPGRSEGKQAGDGGGDQNASKDRDTAPVAWCRNRLLDLRLDLHFAHREMPTSRSTTPAPMADRTSS